ncbi:Hsp20/alpha crystallin family protein [bacterium AH-315-C07]|nr:Hsp20/alpha crystallin family protein [bacterium AH-315-C07]
MKTLVRFPNYEGGTTLSRHFGYPSLFNSLFNSVTRDFNYSADADCCEPRSTWTPAVNVNEDEKHYYIDVNAAGLSKDDFNVEVDKDVLVISGERKTKDESTSDNFTRREFSYGSFKRSFTLPENIKEDKIKADYKDGILSVVIPKAEPEKVKTSRVISIG